MAKHSFQPHLGILSLVFAKLHKNGNHCGAISSATDMYLTSNPAPVFVFAICKCKSHFQSGVCVNILFQQLQGKIFARRAYYSWEFVGCTILNCLFVVRYFPDIFRKLQLQVLVWFGTKGLFSVMNTSVKIKMFWTNPPHSMLQICRISQQDSHTFGVASGFRGMHFTRGAYTNGCYWFLWLWLR